MKKILLLIITILILPNCTNSKPQNPPNSTCQFSISPLILDITLDQENIQTEGIINITNQNLTTDEIIKISTDRVKTDYNNIYGSFITLSKDQIFLNENEKIEYKFKVSKPAEATNGTYSENLFFECQREDEITKKGVIIKVHLE